jgi:four helix bundle protein
MPFMFEKLEVYQKAVDFTDRVTALAEKFARGYAFLADQLNRASLSVATNLAEGNGRFTKADRKHFFTMARASGQECVPLLELARRRALVGVADHAALREQLEVIAKMISGLIAGLDNRNEQHRRATRVAGDLRVSRTRQSVETASLSASLCAARGSRHDRGIQFTRKR